MRTMDAFWRGQILSKEWLIKELENQRPNFNPCPTIDIHGGWVGTLSSLLFQSRIDIEHINSIDIDPECEEIARTMNQMEHEAGKFHAITHDMCTFRSDADIVINTSFEHILQEDYDLWLSGLPQNSLIVLQSNNYDIPEHIRIAKNLNDFKSQAALETIFFAGELPTQMYTRFMIIGKK